MNWDKIIVKSQEVVNILAVPVCTAIAIIHPFNVAGTAAAVVGAFNALADCVLYFIRKKAA